MFFVGYLFAHQIEQATAKIRHWQQGITWGLALGLATWVLIRLVRFYKARRTIGQPVGPPVLVDDAPLPPDDLHSGPFAALPAEPPAATVVATTADVPADPPTRVESADGSAGEPGSARNGHGEAVAPRRASGVGSGGGST
jgi:hypothetical protein